MSDSNKPAFIAYVVEENKAEGGKDFYQKIGVAWRIKEGEALSVRLVANPIDGKFVLWPPKEKESGN